MLPAARSLARLLVGIALVVPVSASAQRDSARAAEWDVTLARGQTRAIDFATSEGTWMATDLSPDGQWLLFDLLGHVYRLPIAGGEAQSLTQNSGTAINYQPRWSPDGRSIAFVSDRRGQNNLWIMNADGSNPRPVFTNRDVRVYEPAWTPDGQYVIVRREFTGRGGGGNGLWILGSPPTVTPFYQDQVLSGSAEGRIQADYCFKVLNCPCSIRQISPIRSIRMALYFFGLAAGDRNGPRHAHASATARRSGARHHRA